MSTDARIERARRWLKEQIEQLKALRNAKTRDTEFKQWRQATLTIIQRVWPGDARRSARFRRIPFSPPSTQASAREMREFYERGCAEAAQLLSGFVEEIEANGLPAEVTSARPASLDPGVAEDDFPTVDLPGGPPKAAEPKPGSEVDTPAADTPERGAVTTSSSGNGPGSRRNGPERRRRHKSGGPRRRLRDMLGLDALEQLGKREDAAHEPAGAAASGVPGATQSDDPPHAERETAPPGADTDAVKDAPSVTEAQAEPPARPRYADPVEVRAEAASDDGDDAVPTGNDPAAGDTDAPAAPALSAPEPVAPAVARSSDAPDDAGGELAADDGPEISADDFLSASPVFRAEGKPVRRTVRATPPPPPADMDFIPAPFTSSTAIALAAVAAEVARLGVPEGHRARTRATLMSLAQLVEDGDIDWDGLRGAVAFAMEFPPVGRRLLPLLIPFLDRAA